MTLSGRYITINGGAPTINDIAVGLSRIPRFVGQTHFEWTVAHHSLVVMHMAERGNITRAMPLHMLLHDAHEMMTGDVPTTFKTFDTKQLQARLDVRIYNEFDVPFPTTFERELIKVYDRRALIAEAYVVCPLATFMKIVDDEPGSYITDSSDVAAVRGVLGLDDLSVAYEVHLRHHLYRVKGTSE